MNWLFCLIGFLLVTLLGCSGNSPSDTRSDELHGNVETTVIIEHQVATSPPSTPVPSEVLSLIAGNLQPVIDSLPEIPTGDFPTKLPSEITEFWRDGNQSYLKSPNALESGSTMELTAVDGNPAWVIYQIPNLLPLTELLTLSIETSEANFGGDDQGYWIGIANYDKESWQVMAKSQATPLKSLTIPGSEPYISTSDRFYMFLMLTGTQSLTVDRVGLEYNSPAWVEVIVDSDADAGWMPAIVFDRLNNPLIAYAELGTGKPRLAVGDRDEGLGDPANWVRTFIDNDPEDSGDPVDDIGAKAKWLDITIDELNGLPRVSMIYDEIEEKEENSRAGMSVMLIDGRWLNYRLGWIDGAEWTSIDSKHGTSLYGMATHAKNENWVSIRSPYDFTYITFDIYNPELVFDLYREFGEDWKFPHLKYDPVTGSGAVEVFGSSGYFEHDAENWESFYGDPLSGEFGSLATNPVTNLLGSTYARIQLDHSDLVYVEYDEFFIGTAETVDTVARTNGVERIGDVSQLAYTPDGTPAIAYTVFDGNLVDIKYAKKVGDVWESVVISNEPSLVESADDLFVVDLAIDNLGVPAVCYHHRDSSGNHSLRVVFNED